MAGAHWLSEVARLTLLAEGGKHRKELNAEYGSGQVVDSASLVFVGARDPSWGPLPEPVGFGGQTAWFAASLGGERW